MDIPSWIAKARAPGASDLLLEAQTQIVARVRGELIVIGERVDGAELEKSVRTLIGASGWADYGARQYHARSPLEYLHTNRRSFVRREILTHSPSSGDR